MSAAHAPREPRRASTRTLLVSLPLVLLLLLSFVASSIARTIVVDVRGAGDHLTIYQGLYNADAGDTVLVMPGIYDGIWNRDLEFGGRGVRLVSARGPEMTWIDCEGLGRAFRFESGEDSTAVVRGFTIRNGRSGSGGSAILAAGASPTLRDLVIEDCHSSIQYWGTSGGAIRCNASAAPLIRDVVFTGNTGDEGGAVLCYGGASPTIDGCTFVGNRGVYGGGAVYCDASNPTIRRCVLAFSSAGGAVDCAFGAAPIIEECIGYGNAGGDEPCGSVAGWLEEDPLFCDIAGGDLRVCSDSPCLPENNPFGVLIGARGAGDCSCPPPPAVWHVPTDFPTIRAALEKASFGDSVLVAPGTYAEHLLRVPWGVTLVGTHGPDSTAIAVGGDRGLIFGDDVLAESGGASLGDTVEQQVPAPRSGPPATLAGFTVTGSTGGAVWMRAASPVIRNCVIRDNVAYVGAGIYCGRHSSPFIEDCRIVNNTGTETYVGYGGGGVCVEKHAAPVFLRTVIANNIATRGAGVYVNPQATVSISESTLAGNSAAIGGGMYVETNASVDTDASVIAYTQAGEPIHCNTDSSVNTTRSVVFGNAAGDSLCGSHDDNVFEDPLFCDWGSGDVSVCSESPCLPANNPLGILIGAEGDGGCPCPTGRVIRVPHDHASIAEAAGVAVFGDTVLVDPGTYDETEIHLRNGVRLVSAAGADSTTIVALSPTAISVGAPSRGSGNTGDVVTEGDDRGATGVRGFTVTGATDSAVRCMGALLELRDMVIEGNTTNQYGAGVFCDGGGLVVADSRFSGNETTGNYYSSVGGAIYCRNSVLHLSGVEFAGNSSFHGGAVYLRGANGPMHDVSVVDCVFHDNDAERGGAIYGYGHSGGTLEFEVRGSTFARNAADRGSAITTATGAVTVAVENSVFAFPLWGASFSCAEGSEVSLSDCVIHADPDGDEPCASLDNVVFADPLFCDIAERDLHVCSESPCLPEAGLFVELVGALGDGDCACPEDAGQVIRVPSDYPTIEQALSHAAYADTVLIAPGVYEERDLGVPLGVAVIGASGADDTTVNAGGSGSVFRLQMMPATTRDMRPTRLCGLTITGADDSAVQAATGRPEIEDCVITGNSGEHGGAIRLLNACSAAVTNVVMVGNAAASGRGGAVSCEDGSDASFTACTFSANSAYRGGALGAFESDVTVERSTFTGNSASYYFGSSISSRSESSVSIGNSILALSPDAKPVYVSYGGTALTTHSIVYGNAQTDSLDGSHHDNLFTNPWFCDWEGGDHGVHANSPALPGNNDWGEQVGAWGEHCGYTVVTVLPDGTGDAPTIQAGIDLCSDGGTVIVEPGLYSGAGNRGINLAGRSMEIISRAGPDSTIIDCEGLDRAFIFESGEDTTSIVRGFFVQNGTAADGGAVLVNGASPLIVDCAFSGCEATRGGAVACHGAGSSPLMRDIHVDSCSADEGGAIWVSDCAMVMTGLTLIDNSAGDGGAVSARGGANLVVRFAELVENAASNRGGGFHVSGADVSVTNTTLLGSSAGSDGAAIACIDSDMHVMGCIVAGSTGSAVTQCEGSGDPVFFYCDFYDNEGGDEFCGLDGIGNISADPRFCDVGSWDLSLCADSPCLVPDAPEGHIGRYAAGCDSCGPASVVLFVRPDGTGDFPTLREAIEACPDGGTVVAATGTFTGPDNRDLDPGGRSIAIRSLNGSAETVIDCEQAGRGFVIASGESDACVIDGFTIRNGLSALGGGILCDGTSPTLQDIVVEFCAADTGGAAAFDGGASPEVGSLTIRSCEADAGGGVACRAASDAVLTEVIIEDCVATDGAGMWTSGASPRLTEATLSGNVATGEGGGVFADGGAAPTIRMATIEGCVSANGGSALHARASSPVMENATVVGCAGPSGGALFFDDSAGTVTGCVIALTEGEATVCSGSALPSFASCILHDNQGGDETCGIDAGGNMIEDPHFCDAPSGDYTVCADSPCLIPGAPGGQIGHYGAGCDSCGTASFSVLADGSGDYPTIQAAVDASDYADVIVVGPGTFSGEGNRDIDFGGRLIVLRSALGSEHTVIDCQNEGRAFRFASGEDTLAVVRGFTITGGIEGDGGAVLASGSSPTIEDCVIHGCSAERGGAVACANGAAPLLRRLEITGNAADEGGGIHASGGAPLLRDVVLRSNSASGRGGGLMCRTNTTLDARRLAFIDNTASASGGGVYCLLSAPLLQNATFVGNGAPEGGALASKHAAPHLNGCIVAFTVQGDAMTCEGTLVPFIEHCVIHGNVEGDALCGVDGGDNHFTDPLFCDVLSGDITLCENSPCFRPVAPEFHVGMYGAGCDSCGTTTDTPEENTPPFATLRLTALPNPFAARTVLHLALPSPGDVVLGVYNLRGQLVRTLLDATLPAGERPVLWDGTDGDGRPLPSGVYFARLESSRGRTHEKLVLLR